MDVTGIWILTLYTDPRSLILFQVSEDKLPNPLASLLPPDPTTDVADLLFDVFPARCFFFSSMIDDVEKIFLQLS